jgi:glucosyl-dolichyl phosphate glucuronosyltransferase
VKLSLEGISVIICAYTEKRWNELVVAVESVQRQTRPSKEVIVVIDHNAVLLARAREKLSGVVIVENTGEKGLSGARNSGAAVAQGTILAFLDDDAIAHPDWIYNLTVCYTSPQVVGVGGRIEPRWSQRRPRWFPAEFNWVIGCTYLGMPSITAPVRNMIGANMSVRKHVLMAVGGFREAFGCNKAENVAAHGSKWLHHYAGDEETEFCIRVTHELTDSVWLYTTSAIVQHQVSTHRGRWSYFLWRCYDEGLGKANLVRLHGPQIGLSSERAYVFETLPKGIGRGFADIFLYGDMAGIARASAIMLGVTATAAGYLVGTVFSMASRRCAVTGEQPLRHSTLKSTV